MGVSRCRAFGVVVALCAAWLAAVASPADAAIEARAHNVLLISVDTLRADVLSSGALGVGGVPPALARLARHAAVFPHAYSPAAWTLPAHASLMTGVYPDRHRVNHPDRRLPADAVTLASVLRAHGFETVAFTGSGYVDRGYGLGAGFAQYDGYAEGLSRARDLPRAGAPDLINTAERFDRAIAFLRQHRPDDPPFLLFAHTFVVHDYFRRRASADDPLACLEHDPADGYVDCLWGRTTCLPSQWALLRDCYRADVDYLDGDLARLLRVLTATGLRRSTLIVLTADHGEGFDPARQRIHHGGRLHADVVRIPLLFEGPGVLPGLRQTPASLIDVMPTILAYLGLPVPPDLDGIALPLTTTTGSDPARVLYAMEHYHWWSADGVRHDGAPRDTPLTLAVITPERWYIRGRAGEELYTQSDSDQRQDLIAAGQAPDDLRRLADMRAAPPALAAAGAHTVAPSDIDSALAERLRALGYRP